MSANPAAAGGENKPVVNNNDNKPNVNHARRGNNNSHRRDGQPKKEKFMGADPNLQGFVFEASPIRAVQAANFEKVDARIKDQIGMECHLSVLESIERDKLSLPEEPSPVADKEGNISQAEAMKFKEKYSRYLRTVDKIETEMKQCYFKYYGQCDDDMRSSLEEDPTFREAHRKKDVIALRKIIKGITFHFRTSEEPIKTLWLVNRDFYNFKQKNKDTTEYYKQFTDLKKLADEMIGSGEGVYFHSALIDIICREKGIDRSTLTTDVETEYLLQGQERMMAMHFIMNADQIRYWDVVKTYDKEYLSGANNFPKTLHAAYLLLKNWKITKNPEATGNTRYGLSFNVNGSDKNEQGDALVNDGEFPPCPRCGRTNHPISKCRAKYHADGTVLHVMGSIEDDNDVSTYSKFGPCPGDIFHCGDEQILEELMFLQPHETNSLGKDQQSMSSRKGIPITWMLLDSQSTVDVFCNADLLEDIHRSDTTLTIRCNAGVKTTSWKGHLPGYGLVWYYPEGIANILSLSRVKQRYRVTYDSATDNCFHVHKDNQKILRFKEATRRLYYFDTADRDETGTMLITTVENNKSKLSAYDYSQAEKARTLQRRIGRPAVKDFIRYVAMNLIPNCPVTIQDIKNAEFLWGPDIGCLKGKTTWSQPSAVRITGTDVPQQIMQQYRDVTLSVDVMKVAGIPFLMTISKHIKFGSAGKLDSMKNTHIITHFKAIIGAYVTRGFKVTLMLADNQFESMRGEIATLGVHLNVTARDEHVPEVERFNRTIKERVRGNYNVLPFQHLPPVFVIEMVYAAVFWRNMFALKGGISKTQSPSEIVLNRKLDYNAHCKVEFGEYVQTHEEHNNDMNSRTIGAIATRPSTGDGAYYFISLATGKRINRRSWTAMPMPTDIVVPQVHRLARRAKANKIITFTNLAGEDLDALYSELDRDEDDLALDAELAGVDDESDDEDEDPTYDPNDDSSSDVESDNDESDDNVETPGVEDETEVANEDANEDEAEDANDGVDDVETPGVATDIDEEEDIPVLTNDYDDSDIPGVDYNVETPGVEGEDEDDNEESESNNERTYQSGGNGLEMNL